MDYDDVDDLVFFDGNGNDVSEVVVIRVDDIVENTETFELMVYNDEERVVLMNDIATVYIADSSSMYTVVLISLL